MWLLSLLLIIHVSHVSAAHPRSVTGGPRGVFESGDIIVGGLFPVHKQLVKNGVKQTSSVKCLGFDVGMFLRSQAMIYSLDMINKSPILPNLKLGYEIYDTCSDVTMAIKGALRLMEERSNLTHECLSSESTVSVIGTKAVVGERYSEGSIAIARLFALPLIPQISYASTSELLSRKSKFPSFLRTVPSDAHQTRAIVEFAKKLNWEIMGAIGSDDEYGKYGVESIIDHMGNDVCLDFKEILPGDFSRSTHQPLLSRLMETVRNSTAEGIVIFTKTSNVRIILEEAIRLGINRTWVAGDTWSTASEIYSLKGIHKIGRVFGFVMKRNDVPGFEEHVRNFTPHQGKQNSFFQDYLRYFPACPKLSVEDPQNCSFYENFQDNHTASCTDIKCLAKFVDQDESYSIYLAVNVIAHALQSLLKCDDVKCERNTTFFPWELLEEIRQVNFTVDNTTHISYDENGDPHLGYDILYWDMKYGNVTVRRIGEYSPSGVIENLPEHLVSECRQITVTVYDCFKTCPSGQELNSNKDTCCKTCNACAINQFSKGGLEKCKSCQEDEYVSPKRDSCLKKQVTYLNWLDGFAIALMVFGAAGLIFTLLVAVLFIRHWNTPIVKGTGGNLCLVILLALVASFCSIYTFFGKPSDASCKAGLPLFAISFTLCVSCILANLFQISVGFAFDVKVRDRLKRLNRPVAIATTCTAVQVALCAVWLSLFPPRLQQISSYSRKIVIQCHIGSNAMLGATMGYIGLLAAVCFLFAFKGKRLPDLYKNSSFITISMLIYLVVWSLFIPVYINTPGKYVQAVQACAMLVSSYSILCCHFCPKCYVMIFRKELNDEKVILDYIKKHYEKKGVSVVTANR
ncbi:hypothetical protein AGOR_G00103150 [Albula goreensis]|uniref:G-protein coupled receptor family C group 6 member A n=1 Tax=Albula goreensis TaxID=1534307 RepID=A0A8T3DFM8_9TELE|nr:hypothetical protein AGOR_G00103150 [Albula goreensis]